MSVCITLCCEAGMLSGTPCEARVSWEAVDDLGGSAVMTMNEYFMLVETGWDEVPEGWRVEFEVPKPDRPRVLCPTHAASRPGG